MTGPTPAPPTQDERLMAGLSHISVLLPMMGVIAPIVIWVTQREKSRFVTFQSLQALAFQLTMVLAWFVGMACYMGSFFTTFLAIPFGGGTGRTGIEPLFGLFFFVPFLVFGAIFLGWFAFTAYGIAGAIQSFQGKPFRYAILGERVARFLEAG